DLLSRRDDQVSRMGQRIFWTLLLGAIAATLLLAGGLDALQNVITTLGFPFCVLLVFMAVALTRALHADYLGYTLDDLVAGRPPAIAPLSSEATDAIEDGPPHRPEASEGIEDGAAVRRRP
ncbi:MAG: BCCT family transporter, partial [Pseudomonadales bacterium]|nr:BCCT family transporter [Pseudomonadales bacterium]